MKDKILIFTTIVLIFLFFTSMNIIDNISYYVFLLIVTYMYALFLSFKKEFLNLFQIFLFMLLLFILGRIFLSIFYTIDFRVLNLWYKGYLSQEATIELLKILIVFLLSISIGFLFFKDKTVKTKNKKEIKINQIIILLFYFFIILRIIKNYIIVDFILDNGYLNFFNGGIQKLKYPFFLKGIERISEGLFILILYFVKNKREYIKFGLIYFIFSILPVLIAGRRGPVMVLMIYLIFLYNERYKIKSKKNVYFIGVVSLFIIQFIANFRAKKETVNILKNLIMKVFYGQGISLLVPAYIIEFKEELVLNHKYPYIFSYFIDYWKNFKSGQTLERIENGNYLGDQLTYFLSEKIYLRGNGTGTSIIAEFYDLVCGNIYFFAFISILYVYLILILNKYKEKNIVYFTFSYYILQSFIFSPRDSIGKSFSKIMIFLPIVLFFCCLNKILNKLKWSGDKNE